MVCLGLEPGAAGRLAQTNPLSYGGAPYHHSYEIIILCATHFYVTFLLFLVGLNLVFPLST